MKRTKILYAFLLLVILIAAGCLLVPLIGNYFQKQQEDSYIQDKIVEIAPLQTVLFDADKEESEPYGTGAYFSFTGSIELTLNSIEVFTEASRYFAYPQSEIHSLEEDCDPAKYNYVELSYTLRNINAQSNASEEDNTLFDAFVANCFIENPSSGNMYINSVFFDSSETKDPEKKAWYRIRVPQGTEKTYKIGYLISKKYDLDRVMLSYGTSSHYKYRTYPAKYSNLSQ